jgi:hypothetical protein
MNLTRLHVGGILRSADRGVTSQPTIDIDSDVHEVRAAPEPEAPAVRSYARLLKREFERGHVNEGDTVSARSLRLVLFQAMKVEERPNGRPQAYKGWVRTAAKPKLEISDSWCHSGGFRVVVQPKSLIRGGNSREGTIMKTATFVRVFGTLILLAVTAIPAVADEIAFDFESPDVSITGLIFTSDTLNVLGNFDVNRDNGNIRWQ